MSELQAELRNRGIEVPFRGIRDYDPEMFAQDLEWVREVLSNNASSVHPSDI